MAAESRQVTLSCDAFDGEAVKRAAYRLSAELVVEFVREEGQFLCTLRAVKPDADLERLEDRFRREVLDYDLRIRIAKETEPVRNLVLSVAFSKTGLQE